MLVNILRQVWDIPGFAGNNPDLLQWFNNMVDVCSTMSIASLKRKLVKLQFMAGCLIRVKKGPLNITPEA
jgi:hypothetical protein